MDIHSLSQQLYFQGSAPAQKYIYGEVLIKIPFLVSKSWRQPNGHQKGNSHWKKSRNPFKSYIVFLFGWLFFFHFVLFFMKCGIHLCYRVVIITMHMHPSFPSSPFKRQNREDCMYYATLGKGKLRKRVYMYIANPYSCISYLQSHILAKFICNAKKSLLEERSQLTADTYVFRVVKNGSVLPHVFPAKVKQGSDLSCFAFHVVNKCTFYDVCHILKIFVLFLW